MAAQETAFTELICSDLKLDPCQWEERSAFPGLQNDPRCLEIDCLVSFYRYYNELGPMIAPTPHIGAH